MHMPMTSEGSMPTMSGMHPQSTGMPMSHDSMMGSMMGMDSMAMTFFTSSTTPLYSMDWMPTTMGQYAGTCIFLILFAAIFRAILALRAHFYPLLAAADTHRNGGLKLESYREKLSGPRRWRAREAVLLGFIDVVLAALGYLLMIAVMTMNVGYFLSVLAGVFIGSVLFGRFVMNAATH